MSDDPSDTDEDFLGGALPADFVTSIVQAPSPDPFAGMSPMEAHRAKQAVLKRLEDELLLESLTTLRDAMAFRDIEPDATEPPVEWRDLAPEERMKRLRVARMAHMPSKDAPVGLKLANNLAVGIIKARAQEKGGPKTLNVQVVRLEMAPAQYPELTVEENDA